MWELLQVSSPLCASGQQPNTTADHPGAHTCTCSGTACRLPTTASTVAAVQLRPDEPATLAQVPAKRVGKMGSLPSQGAKLGSGTCWQKNVNSLSQWPGCRLSACRQGPVS